MIPVSPGAGNGRGMRSPPNLSSSNTASKQRKARLASAAAAAEREKEEAVDRDRDKRGVKPRLSLAASGRGKIVKKSVRDARADAAATGRSAGAEGHPDVIGNNEEQEREQRRARREASRAEMKRQISDARRERALDSSGGTGTGTGTGAMGGGVEVEVLTKGMYVPPLAERIVAVEEDEEEEDSPSPPHFTGTGRNGRR